MGKSSVIGKRHVLSVRDALNVLLIKESIEHFDDTTIQTATFIKNLYPNIQSLKSKFDMVHPDQQPDLILHWIICAKYL